MNNTLLTPAPHTWTYPILTKPFTFKKVQRGNFHFFLPELEKYHIDFPNAGKFHLYATHKPHVATPCRGKMFSHTFIKDLDFTLSKKPLISEVCVILEESMVIGSGSGPAMVLLPFVIALCKPYYNPELNIFEIIKLQGDQYINFNRLPLVENYLNFTNEFNMLLRDHNLHYADQQDINILHDQFMSYLAYKVNALNLSTEQTYAGLDLFIHRTLHSDLTPDSVALLINECFSVVPM